MQDGSYRVLNNKFSMELIESYFIKPELLEFLVLKNSVMYSYDMACLYGFNVKRSYDYYQQRRAFKRVKDKEKILVKQKQGIFN